MRKSSYLRVVYLASHNRNKVSEVQSIAGHFFNIKSLLDLDKKINWNETGDTFEENALIKAQAAKQYTKSCVLGDDSGLVVPALNGEPGVYSARYAGEENNDEANLKKLLRKLSPLTEDQRKAYFQCTLAFINEHKQTQVYSGFLEGKIIDSPRGSHGFGYDPIFIPKHSNKTLAQMLPDEKNKISHRKKALDQWLVNLP